MSAARTSASMAGSSSSAGRSSTTCGRARIWSTAPSRAWSPTSSCSPTATTASGTAATPSRTARCWRTSRPAARRPGAARRRRGGRPPDARARTALARGRAADAALPRGPLRRHRDRLRRDAAAPAREHARSADPLGHLLRRRVAPARGRRERAALPRPRGGGAREELRLPRRLPALRGRARQGLLRGARARDRPRPDLHPRARRPAPGPPARRGPDLEHLARPSDPRVRDPEVRRRPRPTERLRRDPSRAGRAQDQDAARGLPLAGLARLVRRRDLPGPLAAAGRRVPRDLRRGLPRPEAADRGLAVLPAATAPPTARGALDG